MTSRPLILLSADDYAITAGVSRAIEDLAERGLLSATSAFVTTRHWAVDAPRLAARRDRLAIGLHFNLTLGAPLGAMPSLAPDGRLPAIGALTKAALTRRIDPSEIEAEAGRQLDRFAELAGVPPDFVDGHQHVHALPQVRDGLLAALRRHAGSRAVLVRDPADRWSRISRRGGARAKAMLLSWLSRGFTAAAARAGCVVNDSFAGVTDFKPEAAASELALALTEPGRLHIAMCHPGFPDAELAAIDPVTLRRRSEYDALIGLDGLAQDIWHPTRAADGAPIDWQREMAGG